MAQLRCVRNRKDANGLEQDPNLIQDKQDDAKTKESRDTKQGRGKTTDRPGGEEMLQTSHKGKTSEMCVRNKRRTPDIQMQGNPGGGGPSERLAVLHEVQAQRSACTVNSSQGNDVEDTAREPTRGQHQRDRDADVHEEVRETGHRDGRQEVPVRLQ